MVPINLTYTTLSTENTTQSASLSTWQTHMFFFLLRVLLECVEDRVGEPVVLPFLVQVPSREVWRKLLHVPHIPATTEDCVVLCGVT